MGILGCTVVHHINHTECITRFYVFYECCLYGDTFMGVLEIGYQTKNIPTQKSSK